MSTIRDYMSSSYYDDTNRVYNNHVSMFLPVLSISNDNGTTNFLGDYASIKNGSYGKLLKAYYAKQKAEGASSSKDTMQKSTMIQSSAETLKKAADALNNDSLWEKKKITKKDEKTGETTETVDYDWDAITKAVKSFVDSYNDAVEEAGESNAKNVLRNTLYMTNNVSKNENLLSKAGITIGKGNKLNLDMDKLKKANISTLKTLFTGYNSLVGRVSQKASSISLAAAKSGRAYTGNGTYSKVLSSLVSGKIDEKV